MNRVNGNTGSGSGSGSGSGTGTGTGTAGWGELVAAAIIMAVMIGALAYYGAHHSPSSSASSADRPSDPPLSAARVAELAARAQAQSDWAAANVCVQRWQMRLIEADRSRDDAMTGAVMQCESLIEQAERNKRWR